MSVHMSDPKIIPFPEKDFPLKRIADAFSSAKQDAGSMTENDKITRAAEAVINAYGARALEQAERLEAESAFPDFAQKVTLRVEEILKVKD